MEPGEPHHRDHWWGHRFTPRLIAPTRSAVWLIEALLPLLVRVDPATTALSGPIALDRPGTTSGEALELRATEESVWVRWRDGVTRFDPVTGTHKSVAVNGLGLAVGDEGVWVLPGNGQVARVHHDAGALEIVGDRVEQRFMIAVGHGAVWTLAAGPGQEALTLARLNPETGETEASLSMRGTLHDLLADSTAVWIHLWRPQPNWAGVDAFLVRIDPLTVTVENELQITPPGAFGTVRDGVLYAPANTYYDAGYGDPTAVRVMDATTGELLRTVPLPGSVQWMVAGPTSVWGCLQRSGQRPVAVEVESDSSSAPRLVGVEQIDISAHLPPPPPRIEARPTEEAIREQLADVLIGGVIWRDPETGAETRAPYLGGVRFEEVRLDGQFPHTEVVVLFRAHQRPGILFGRRRRIWDDDGTLTDITTVMTQNLSDDIWSCGYHLPESPQPDESGIAWF